MESFLKGWGYKLNDDQNTQIFKYLDVDKDNAISYSDFV